MFRSLSTFYLPNYYDFLTDVVYIKKWDELNDLDTVFKIMVNL